MLPFVFEDGIGFERYVDYALDVPMYFVYRDGTLHRRHAASRSATSWPASCRPCRASGRRMNDWADHLTTIFPEVRLKRYLEMRGADAGPWRAPVRPAGAVGRAALRRGGAGCRLGPVQGLDRRGARPCCGPRCRATRWTRCIVAVR